MAEGLSRPTIGPEFDSIDRLIKFLTRWPMALLFCLEMRHTLYTVCAAALLAGCAHSPQPSLESARMQYPPTRATNQIDQYHGTSVADPYRWLEDDNSPETKAWVEAENKETFDYLARLPQRETIKQRLTQLWNYERYSVPQKQGNRYFLSKNNGLQNQSVLYWMASLTDEPKALLDPNTLSADGTIALAGTSVSEDGKLLGYPANPNGSAHAIAT